MLLYDYTTAPAPRRVRIFVAEKGLSIETEQVDLRQGGQFVPEFSQKNPDCTVPALCLDDGVCISGVMPICRYLDSLEGAPPLLGQGADSRAVVDMWQERVERGYNAAVTWYRNSVPGMKGRALPGRHAFEQIPALAERGRCQWGLFMEDMESWLAERPFISGESFTVADITAWVALDFVASRLKYEPPEEAAATRRWRRAVEDRPSIGGLDS